MYDFTLSGKNASALGVFVIQRPNIPTPKKRIEKKNVNGRNGILTIEEDTFEEINFAVECNFMSSKPENFADKARVIKAWIYSNQQSELLFNDDQNHFYKTQIIEMSDIERISKRIGTFTLNCTCDPFIYLTMGKKEISISSTIVNLYYLSAPIYKLAGEGVFSLTVNNNTFQVNVAQNAVIDTDLMLVYREDNGQLINQNSLGSFEGLWLKNGTNSISYTVPENGKIKMIPNWRTL